ncbi:hemerythrin family protein [Seongchinamella sediminis]|nr:hemerythrin family protein [Seongchinamella sediminis]
MRKTSELIWQDAQHQVLFEILDEIAEPGCSVDVLSKLLLYTETHFALEERYMELLDYPDRDDHREAHDRFREEINQLLQPGQDLDAAFRELISTYLTEWLTRHVFGVDKELEAFILRSSAK